MELKFAGSAAKFYLLAALDELSSAGLDAPLEAEVIEPDAGSAGFSLRIRVTQDSEVPLFIEVLRQGIPEDGRSLDIRLWLEGRPADGAAKDDWRADDSRSPSIRGD